MKLALPGRNHFGLHSHHTLRRWLIMALLPVIALSFAVELWFTYRNAIDVANAAYDRSLLGAIKAIRANISTASGGLSVELPYRLFELFELTANGDVFFRVATEDNLVEIGSPNLPLPNRLHEHAGQPVFYDGLYFSQPVRLGFVIEALAKPLANGSSGIVIQVAESVQSREIFTNRFVLNALGRYFIFLTVLTLLGFFAVSWALRPLSRLRQQIEERSPDDLTPMVAEKLPRDLLPLVDAVNLHVARNHQLSNHQRQFLDDASHQLRTPLSTLRTQLDYALRAQSRMQIDDALEAMSRQLERAIRGTNQLLALARSDAAQLTFQTFDASALLRKIAVDWLPQAQQRCQDFGVELPSSPVMMSGHADMLQEALDNLIGNAIHYTPEEGRITLSLQKVDDHLLFSVQDNGPGVAPEILALLGTRFMRARTQLHPGTGLGLAIVHSIAQRHQGQLRLSSSADGGFVAVLVLPINA